MRPVSSSRVTTLLCGRAQIKNLPPGSLPRTPLLPHIAPLVSREEGEVEPAPPPLVKGIPVPHSAPSVRAQAAACSTSKALSLLLRAHFHVRPNPVFARDSHFPAICPRLCHFEERIFDATRNLVNRLAVGNLRKSPLYYGIASGGLFLAQTTKVVDSETGLCPVRSAPSLDFIMLFYRVFLKGTRDRFLCFFAFRSPKTS